MAIVPSLSGALSPPDAPRPIVHQFNEFPAIEHFHGHHHCCFFFLRCAANITSRFLFCFHLSLLSRRCIVGSLPPVVFHVCVCQAWFPVVNPVPSLRRVSSIQA